MFRLGGHGGLCGAVVLSASFSGRYYSRLQGFRHSFVRVTGEQRIESIGLFYRECNKPADFLRWWIP
jgi:hypothetical protein